MSNFETQSTDGVLHWKGLQRQKFTGNPISLPQGQVWATTLTEIQPCTLC